MCGQSYGWEAAEQPLERKSKKVKSKKLDLTCRHAEMQNCRHADMQTCRHAEMQNCRHADMQICRPKVKSVILVPGRPPNLVSLL